jgi:hypothetical protein
VARAWLRRITFVFLGDTLRQTASNLRQDGTLWQWSTWKSAGSYLFGKRGLVRQTFRPWRSTCAATSIPEPAGQLGLRALAGETTSTSSCRSAADRGWRRWSPRVLSSASACRKIAACNCTTSANAGQRSSSSRTIPVIDPSDGQPFDESSAAARKTSTRPCAPRASASKACGASSVAPSAAAC